MQYRFITLLFILISQIALAQPSIKTKIDSTNMMIGEQMKMTIELQYSDNTEVLMPKNIQLGNNIEVLNGRDSLAKIADNEFLITKEMIITSFDSGIYNIPAIPIAIKEEGKNWDTIFSKPIQLTVISPVIDTTQTFAPIKDIFQEALSFKEDILPIILAASGVIILIVLVWLFVRKKEKNPVKVSEPAIEIPAHIIALKALKELDSKQLWQQEQFKAYYSELSYIMRDYLENRFDINALESVTDEILRNLQPFAINKIQIEHLKNILQTADLVKFAKVQPNESEHQNMMQLSIAFVEETQFFEEEKTDGNLSIH